MAALMLENKVALVTGAGSGIGRATALLFAREGARVAVADVDEAGVTETAELIQQAGGDAFAMVCDVTDQIAVNSMVANVVSTYGALHCAHNNAGVEGEYGRTAETTAENFDFTYGVNLKGVFHCLQAEILHMQAHGGGAIVNTASVAGIEGARQLPAYVASKHACMGLTRTAALEYASRGIRINAVCPGPIRTPMIEKIMAANPRMEQPMLQSIPLRRIGEPQDIGEAVLWLCSDRSAYVTGHGLVVDGGMTAGT
jgi:NAD(P)-dependent dehydrogenase (short-subunit alcohol dehydrogenase family)